VLQHGRPEQGMEIQDILADEVVQLRLGSVAFIAFTLPVFIEV
jgi:hypothetical protein